MYYVDYDHPILNSLYSDIDKTNCKNKTCVNRIYPITYTNKSETEKTDKNFTNNLASNHTSPNANTYVYNYNMKFFYNFDTDKAGEVNILFRKFTNYEDNLYSYSVLQERVTKDLFMHIKSKNGKYYLNGLSPLSNYENKFYFRFKKTSSLTIRMKSIESWNIIRHEVLTPFPICNVTSSLAEDEQMLIDDLLPSKLLNCENFDEKAFFSEIEQRPTSKKYKYIHETFTNEVKRFNNYEAPKCIFIEYFGRIFSRLFLKIIF
jgi:hypothetical protein